jgi:predicted RNase H-like HicB family nuclease
MKILLDEFTAMIYCEDKGFVALCPELDVASQGDSVEDASSNLREAVELFLESADPSEVATRISAPAVQWTPGGANGRPGSSALT